MKHAVLMCDAIVAALMLLGAAASQAQDVHQEIDAIIKDYLATHRDDSAKSSKAIWSSTPRRSAK